MPKAKNHAVKMRRAPPTASSAAPRTRSRKAIEQPLNKLTEDAHAQASPGRVDPGKMGTTDSSLMDSSFLWPLLTEAGWRQQLSHLFGEKFFKLLDRQVQQAYSQVQVLPPQEDIFRAFNLTPLNKVKVVILGQDPYHDIGQAHGLSFSVPRGMKIPPSLRNIYKELSTDYPGFKAPNHGCLEEWAERGVLLLNATLTVQAHKPNSHAQFGWQLFTDDVIRALSGHLDGVVFVLWGEFAKKKKKLINLTKHRVIETAHPSPLSCRFFFGCKCFSKTNEELKKLKKGAIDWTLSP